MHDCSTAEPARRARRYRLARSRKVALRGLCWREGQWKLLSSICCPGGRCCCSGVPEPVADTRSRQPGRHRSSAVLEAADDDCEAFLLASFAAAWREAHPNWLVVGVLDRSVKLPPKKCFVAVGATRRVHATAGNHNNLIGRFTLRYFLPRRYRGACA